VDETAAGTPQTVLSPAPTKKNALVTEALGPVTVEGEVATVFPWRVILVGETPAKLAGSNGPRPVPVAGVRRFPRARPSNWIKPGKAIRETSLSTPGGIACIDFAAENGLSYILYDAGWYGPESSDASDARAVNLDPARISAGHPGLDLSRVIAYGETKRRRCFPLCQPPRPGAAASRTRAAL
jgi:alpha-glucosidase